MGKLLVRCPKTGQAIFTGRYVNSATFRSTPVFFSPNYRPLNFNSSGSTISNR